MSVPYLSPAELADAMSDPEAIVDDGSVMTAAELLAWHHDNPPKRQDILGDFVRDVWGRGR